MTNVKPFWLVALGGLSICIAATHAILLTFLIFSSFIRWDFESFMTFDWTDVRICVLFGFLINIWWLFDGKRKDGGKREWHQATADKFEAQGE